MKNKIVLFSNIKGGVGKSTLCILFAHYLVSKGISVSVVDADIQRTISRQRERDKSRCPESPEPWEVISIFDVGKKDGNAKNIIPVLQQEEGWILVDCPGNMEVDRLVPFFKSADAVVIPTSYAEPDIDATLSLFVPTLRDENDKAKFIFVPNRINDKMQKDMEDIKAARHKAISLIKGWGHVTAKIKQSVIFEPHRFNTMDKLTMYQSNGVKYPFEEIISSL